MTTVAPGRKGVGPLRTLFKNANWPHTSAGAVCKTLHYNDLQSGRPDSNR
jgi:hypothetical protein